jgi:Skp family chaperone for outer membrane proteins
LIRLLVAPLLAVCLAACQSAYYQAAEQVGYHKREILVDRVEDARDAQVEAEEQFQSAQEQLLVLIEFDGGDIHDAYENLSEEYESALAAATNVGDKIDSIEHVADALFDEWAGELEEYTNTRLKADSARKLKETQRRYGSLIKTMRRSEQRMEPVLAALKDNVLYLKHNLNAQAVAALRVEFNKIDRDIDLLIVEMKKAIASSNEFIDSLKQSQ